MATIDRPAADEYAGFFAGYVSLVPEKDALAVLEAQPQELGRIAASVAPERERHRYEPGKWSIRELFGHLGDAERVFGYRAFCIARGDQSSFPGFDEQAYIAASSYDEQSLPEHVAQIQLLREANLRVLRRLDAPALARRGTANANTVSVRALAFIMAGHVRHHVGVLRKRYGVGG